MKVLVDTSVWIDHFHNPNTRLQELLKTGAVFTHTVVIGELAAGRLKHREAIIAYLQKLPRADEIDLSEGLHLIETHVLFGAGLSWSDVQLLAAARIDHLTLWTHDKALRSAAARIELNVFTSH